MTRTMQAVRVQLVTWRRTQLLPWAVLALVVALNVGIFAFTPVPDSGRKVSGGIAEMYIFPLAFVLQSVTQTFPFSAGLGLTRKAFASGLVLIVAVQAVVWGTALFLLSLLEGATGGFGVSIELFRLPGLLTANRGTQLVIFIAPFLLTGLFGFFLGTLTKRWGLVGVLGFIIGLIAAGGLIAIGITWRHNWSPLLSWVGDRSALTSVAGSSLVLALLCAAGGWVVLRRTPA